MWKGLKLGGFLHLPSLLMCADWPLGRTSDSTLSFAGYHLIGCQKLFNPAVSENIEYIEINIYIFFIFPKFDVLCGLKCEAIELYWWRPMSVPRCVNTLRLLMYLCNPPKPHSFSQLPLCIISLSSLLIGPHFHNADVNLQQPTCLLFLFPFRVYCKVVFFCFG